MEINEIEQLLSRKEFYELKKQHYPESIIEDEYAKKLRKELLPASHQLFARNFMNPNTKYKHLFIKHGTGTGKTLLAIFTAMEFVREYQKLYKIKKSKTEKRGYSSRRYLNKNTPNIFIIGFEAQKREFINELLRFPDFGFITPYELEHLDLLMENAINEQGQQFYEEEKAKYKQRITDKSKGGFFTFYGYQEFVNKLFLGGDNKRLIEIEEEIRRRQGLLKKKKMDDLDELIDTPLGDSTELNRAIDKMIKSGEIRINEDMLTAMENSLMICDEIHNTYNTNMKNNRGIALEYVSHKVPSLRQMFLSATITNNSASEIIDVLNYTVSDINKKLKKQDFFQDNITLKAGALERIGKLSRGYFSFLQDINPEYYPRVSYVGNQILDGTGKKFGYVNFHFCEMKGKQKALYEKTFPTHSKMMKKAKREYPHGERLKIQQHLKSAYDMALPTDEKNVSFNYGEVMTDLENGDSQYVKIIEDGSNKVLGGSFLKLENLEKYSAKYTTLVRELIKSLTERKQERMIIYHHFVQGTAILQIAEILRENGFLLGVASEPSDDTRCSICGKLRRDHKAKEDHTFNASRFVLAYSGIQKNKFAANMTTFKSYDNSNGEKIQIFVGSQIIKESVNFMGVNRMFICSIPINISTMIQVTGRANRKGSHLLLPPAKQYVQFHILVTKDTAEEFRYFIKLKEYTPIQEIDKEINANAIDASIHRDIIWPPSSVKKSQGLGTLYYDPVVNVKAGIPLKNLYDYTFRAYDYFREEIRYIVMYIKRLFTIKPVYTYGQLRDAIMNPPFDNVQINTKLFDERNIIIGLTWLTNHSENVSIEYKKNKRSLVDQLMDYNNVFIGKSKAVIHHVGKYYVLAKSTTKIDANDFLLNNPKSVKISINGNNATKDFLVDNIYKNKRKEIVKEFGEPDDLAIETLYMFVLEVPKMLQVIIIGEAIASQFWSKGKSASELRLYKRILDLYNDLKILIKIEDIKKYNIANVFKTLPKNDQLFIGHESQKNALILSPINFEKGEYLNKWTVSTKESLNRVIKYRESSKSTGILSVTPGGNMVFKIRRPYTEEEIRDIADKRSMETGVNCDTRQKAEIIEDLKKFGISIDEIDKSDQKVHPLCNILFLVMMQYELYERKHETRKKIIYFWWN